MKGALCYNKINEITPLKKKERNFTIQPFFDDIHLFSSII